MAQNSTAKDRQTRDRLVQAAHVLRAQGQPELAEAVDYTLSPSGAGMLRRLLADAQGKALDENLAISMQRTQSDHFKRAAAAAGDDLTKVVEDGIQAFIDGDFRPGRPKRTAYGSGDRVNLNVRPDPLLRRLFSATAEAVGDNLGWKPALSAVVRLWLMEKYPMPKPKPQKARRAGKAG